MKKAKLHEKWNTSDLETEEISPEHEKPRMNYRRQRKDDAIVVDTGLRYLLLGPKCQYKYGRNASIISVK